METSAEFFNTENAYGQLVQEDNSLLDKTFLYEYNDIGNITKVQSYPIGDPDAPSEDWTEQTFAYGTGANSDRLTSFDGKAITYNTNGEVASYDGWNYTWTNGRLTQIKATGSNATRAVGIPASKTYNFTYNAAGQRVKSEYSYILGSSGSAATGEVTSFTKNYVYDSFGRLVSETGSETLHNVGTNNSTMTFLYDGNTVVGIHYTSSKYGTNTYYFRRNLQGDVVEIYDTNGVRKVKYNYDAWGNCTIASQTTDAVLARVNPIRYRGYYYDAGTGLYYLNARYYNPQWRRFISPDSTEYIDPESVNGLNRYVYCNNDPVNYADPNGHSFILAAALILMGVGVAAGLGYAAYTDYSDDYDINGSVGWQTYAGSAIIGGAIGFGIGYFGPSLLTFLGSSFSFTLPTLGIFNMGGALALVGGTTITVTGAQIAGGAIAAGAGVLMFAKASTGPIRFNDGTGINPETGKPVTNKDEAYRIYKQLRDNIQKAHWKKWMKGKGWRTNHLK